MNSLRHSKLFWKAFLSLLLGLVIWFPIFYALTVPYLNRLAYEVEEVASKNVLKGVVQVVKNSSQELTAWRKYSLERHRGELRVVLALIQSHADELEQQVAGKRLSYDEARTRLLNWLRTVRYGENGYVWAANEASVLLSHPASEFHGKDASALKDEKGNLVVPPMVAIASAEGEGFYSYWWPRLKTGHAEEKLSYFRYFRHWGLVIGTGLYVEDLDEEMQRRKTELASILREYLHSVRLASSGYVFVIDGEQNVIVHPDARIEGGSVRSLRDPLSGKALGPMLIAAAQTPEQPLSYAWNHPDDPENYTHRKLSWVYHVAEYDWYLGASVYVDDLGRSGDYLRDRMLLAFVLGLLITAVAAFLFMRHLTAPIMRLVHFARRQAAGDLSAICDVRRDDEIGVLSEAFNRMVLAQAAQIDALRDAELRVRRLLEQSLAGIFVIQDGHFCYANPAFVRMMGFASAEELSGLLSFATMLQPEGSEEVLRHVAALLSGEQEGCECSFAVQHKNASSLYLRGSFRLVEFEGVSSMMGVVLDISESQRAEKAREEALLTAQELSNLKSQFIANISHELRTPLNAVIGLAYLGKRCGDVAKAQHYFQQIYGSGNTLLEMLISILDFSDLERGKLVLQEGEFDLREMLQQLTRIWALRAEGKEVSLHLEVSSELPAVYFGDRDRLQRLLGGILSNAIKFTPHGDVRLQARLDQGMLRIDIADSGIGMSQETISHLFRPFEQLDGRSTRLYGGIGLGLALARELLLVMGGYIEVSSELGKGSVFSLFLPGHFPGKETAVAAGIMAISPL